MEVIAIYDRPIYRTKCDRQQPCSTCALRGQPCTYAPEKRGLLPLLPKSSPPDRVQAMHDRLVQLESLVMQISKNPARKPGPQTGPWAASDNQAKHLPEGGTPATERSEGGSLRVSGSEVHYVNDEHWATIMDNIAVLKDHFDRGEQPELIISPGADLRYDNSRPSDLQQGALLLYGCHCPVSREQILASLPPKDSLDRHISRYFNCVELVASCEVLFRYIQLPVERLWLTCLVRLQAFMAPVSSARQVSMRMSHFVN